MPLNAGTSDFFGFFFFVLILKKKNKISVMADSTVAPRDEDKKATSVSDETLREWKSCCFTLHPQILVFVTQVFFSAFLIFFSAYKLVGAGQPDPLYVSMLTTTVGVWLPSPLHSSAKGSLVT